MIEDMSDGEVDQRMTSSWQFDVSWMDGMPHKVHQGDISLG